MSIHGWNQYENHVHQMYDWVSNYSHSFDPSAPPQQIIRNEGLFLPANELHSVNTQQNEFGKKDLFFGVFVFKGITGRQIKVSIRKKFEFQKKSNVIKSRTKVYVYNISWDTHKENFNATRIFRFDSSDHWHHPTPNHFHVELKVPTKRKHEISPTPVHTEESYPQISDIFDVAYKLSNNEELNVIHSKILMYFKNLNESKKSMIQDWYPGIKEVLPFSF